MADAETNAQSEIEILIGKRTVEVGGEQIEVREFTFEQEFEALPVAGPIIHALADLFSGEDEPDELALELVFAQHREAFYRLLSISTGREPAWLRALPGRDGRLLYLTFWAVNQHFFIQRVANRYLAARVELRERLMQTLSARPSQH